nr:HNH endonuclease family protein [Pseudoclavibacter chungangensis]
MLGDGCRVERGSFHDPYSGETVEFVRGPGTSDDVQIDHVVALYNSWRTGAQDLSFDERVALANDPLNLQPTLDWVNDEKMSQDASQWLPPSESYHCVYVARQIAVKASYELWVTAAERDAMTRVLHDCGG